MKNWITLCLLFFLLFSCRKPCYLVAVADVVNKIEFVNFSSSELDSVYVFQVNDSVRLSTFPNLAQYPEALKANQVQNNLLDLGMRYTLQAGTNFYVYTKDTSMAYFITASSIIQKQNPYCPTSTYDFVDKIQVNGVEQTRAKSKLVITK